jgi:DNA sulfur modification protein DndE
MRGRGGMIEKVWFEHFHLSGLRKEAILLNMLYGSSSAESASQVPPTFRDIYIGNVVCENASTGIAVRGLPEQPIQRAVFDQLELNSDQGIICSEAADITLKNVTIRARQEPLFSATNITRLQTTDLTLINIETERANGI